eukprot:1033992_1
MQRDVDHHIDSLLILNFDEDESTTTPIDIFVQSNPMPFRYIVSDVDEELLILLEFKPAIDLCSIQLYASTEGIDHGGMDVSEPKNVHIFHLSHLNVNFNDILQIKPNKSIHCSTKKMAKGQKIKLSQKAALKLKFKHTKYLAIYVESNQRNTEKTLINRIKLHSKPAIAHPKLTLSRQAQKVSASDMYKPLTSVPEHKSDDVLIQKGDSQCSDVQHCPRTLRLINVLNRHSKHKYFGDMDATARIQIVRDYFHVIDQHDALSEVEWIVSRCVACDINTCTSYVGNQSVSSFVSDPHVSAFEQIADKMHSHLFHCFDTGSRLTSAEMAMALTMESEMAMALTIRQMVRSKRNQHGGKVKRMMRYNQLFERFQVNEDNNSHGAKTEYDFGVKFAYGYTNWGEEVFDSTAVQCMAHYSSLKEELVNNCVCRIESDQFEIEFQKATIYHAALLKLRDISFHALPLECILALLIYCNYTQLQSQFSKTYRKEFARDHTHFYHLGKLLKESVQEYGKISCYPPQHSFLSTNPPFYHGIDQSMFEPSICGFDTSRSINIHCPLSTSSSLAVAMRFSNAGSGLIISFKFDSPIRMAGNESHHFSTAWLSDYPNELEHLFIQNNNPFQRCCIDNIVDVNTGRSYNRILEAIKMFHLIIREKSMYTSYVHHDIRQSILIAIRGIISQQLKLKIGLTGMDTSGERLITMFLNSVASVCLDFEYYHTQYSVCFDALLHSAHNWFHLRRINALFPNMMLFEALHIPLSTDILESLLVDFAHCSHTISWSITSIWIHATHNSTLSVADAVDNYTEPFANVNAFLVCNLYNRELHLLHKRSVAEIALFLVDHFWENLYYLDEEGTIEKEIHKLLESKSCTAQQVNVSVKWNNIALNPNSYFVRHFCEPQHQWLNMKMITKVFPNIETLHVGHISLSSFIIDDVLHHLRTTSHCMWRVVLQDIHRFKSHIAIVQSLSKYKQDFKQIGFDIHYNKQNDKFIDSIVIEEIGDKAVMSGITSILNDTLEGTTTNVAALNTRLFHDTPISQHLKNNAVHVSCMISPSHAQGNNSGHASNSQQESTKESTDNNGTNDSSNNHSNNGQSGGGSGGSGRGNEGNGNNDDKKDEKDKKDETDETDEEEEKSNKKQKTKHPQNVSKESDKQSHQPQQILTQMLPNVHFTQIEATTAHVMRNTATLRANQQRLDGNNQRNLMSAPLSFGNTQAVTMPLYSTPSCIQSTACSHNTVSQPNLQHSEQKLDASHPPSSRNLPNGKPKGPNEFIKYKAQPHGMIRHPFIDKNRKYQRFRSTIYSFAPSVSIGSKHGSLLVHQIIPNAVQETFVSASDIFEYTNITIAMQFNDTRSRHIVDTKVINCNFHASTANNEPLYCVIRRVGRGPKWKMEEALFTKTDVSSESLPIPKPSRLQSNFQRQLRHRQYIRDCMQQSDARENLIHDTKWTKVLVYSKPNIKKTQRNIHQITKNRFVKHLQYNVFNDSDLVPMIMFYHDMHRVEYVWIVTITGNHCKINVGISMIYKMDLRQVEVTGIHVDKMDIIKQHRWVPILSQNTMTIPPCLRTFASCDHIAIGNPDTTINHIKNVLAENRRLLERIQELEQQLQNERNLESAMNTSIPSETTVSSISSTN